ncbi:MBL fold metallo-hydrolase [Hymenobacter fastidiosus]|uniref:MBL fold metallo-hydrolase n=1 Tax=Hymenobacter fastidiosus TaxID=486264 RepID=A0ABP7SWM7_9BACT
MSSITFARNERLRTVKAGYAGNKRFGSQFANGDALYNPDFSNVFRWKFLTKNPQKAEKKADTWVPAVVDCTAFLRSKADGLVWLGHASFVLRTGGVTLLFDPILFDSRFLRRRHPLPCRPEELTNIDYLLLSHGHRDHLDEASFGLLARQNPQLRVLTGLGMAPVLRGMARAPAVQEAGWWQQYDLGPGAPLEICYLPAAHWYRRGLADTNKALWGSFLIRAQDKLLYFAADSSYAGHFEEIERQFGPIDICLIGIGAYKPAFMMQHSHTNPHEAAKAANVLRAGHVVPMHHGTFDLSDEPASEPLRTFRDVATGGMLRGELHAPAVGEVLPWAEWE